jgi:hypothetical protein
MQITVIIEANSQHSVSSTSAMEHTREVRKCRDAPCRVDRDPKLTMGYVEVEEEVDNLCSEESMDLMCDHHAIGPDLVVK